MHTYTCIYIYIYSKQTSLFQMLKGSSLGSSFCLSSYLRVCSGEKGGERENGREHERESVRVRERARERERENERERMTKKDKRGERKREKKGNAVGLVSTFPYSEYVVSQMCVRHVA